MRIQLDQIITFNQAIEIVQTEDKKILQERKEALKEYCYLYTDYSIFDFSDYNYYAEKIGCDIGTLLDIQNAVILERIKEKKELESKIKPEMLTGYFKYNPFKKQFYKYHIELEKWRPARNYELKEVLKSNDHIAEQQD